MTITEVMYDVEGSDEAHEWIEVQNTGTEPIDFSKHKLFERNAQHKLVFVKGEEKISPSHYAVIVQNSAQFEKDNPSFSGTIFDSSFSLANTVDIFSIQDEKGNNLDTYSYNSGLGGAGDGKSLQKIDRNWAASVPTPGRENMLVVQKISLPHVPNNIPKTLQKTEIKSQNSEKNNQVIQHKKLEATVIENKIIGEKVSEKMTGNSPIIFILFIILMIFSVLGVYSIRKKKSSHSIEEIDENDASDFEIVD